MGQLSVLAHKRVFQEVITYLSTTGLLLKVTRVI